MGIEHTTVAFTDGAATRHPLFIYFSIMRLMLLVLLAFTATPGGREEGTLSLRKCRHYVAASEERRPLIKDSLIYHLLTFIDWVFTASLFLHIITLVTIQNNNHVISKWQNTVLN